MTRPAAPYLHGTAGPEQQRLLAQARHWKDRLILPGSHFARGTRLLEVGCGVGAVMGVLGRAFPGVQLLGVDREPAQLRAAKAHLQGLGLKAALSQADALALPQATASIDAAWMMWFLEHVGDPVAALAEARRALKPGGLLTAIEVDYQTIRLNRPAPAFQALLNAFCKGMDRHGRSDAGAHLGRWMAAAGFARVQDQSQPFVFQGAALAREAEYLLGFIEPSLADLAALPLAPSRARLQDGARELRAFAASPGAQLRFEVHKARAWA